MSNPLSASPGAGAHFYLKVTNMKSNKNETPVAARPLIIAHRGASGVYPENTILAIKEAYNNGADLIEIDVRLTHDGHVVLLHDAFVDRTTDGSGRVDRLTLVQTQLLDAGFRFTRDGQTFPFAGHGLKIPVLSEVLAELPTAKFQIELKDNSLALAVKVLEIVRSHQSLERTQIASAFGRLLSFIHKAEQNAVLAHSAFDAIKFVLCALIGHAYSPCFHAGFIDLPLRSCRYQHIVFAATRLAAKQGLRVRAYTVNDLDKMKSLVNMGLQGFFTDYPAEARLLVDALQERKLHDG